MKSLKMLIILSVILSIVSCKKSEDGKAVNNFPTVEYEYLVDNFKSPPTVYGVNCWWWWLNGNVTKEAITKDLEAMKSRNFQGAMVFDAGGQNQGGNKDTPAGPLYGSKEWNDLFVFALDEAKRLGLEMGFNIQSGWNLGGPRVPLQYAAKQLTYSETKINGGSKVQISLENPSKDDALYKDIAVLAFPLKEENVTEKKITYLNLKLGFHELGGSAPDTRFLLNNNSPDKNNAGKTTYIIKKDDIIDVTEHMDKDGNLTWEFPTGQWSIMRIGYSTTKAAVSTSSKGWEGNVLDYMSKEAFDFYWNDVVEPILKASGEHVGTTLKYMETDSWECGGMNWTDSFPEEFNTFCGYDLLKYIPIIGGYVIENVDTSNAFLADFRKTIADLVANNHYAYFAEYAHKYNMGIQPESAGPHAGPLDGIKNYGFSDIVMSEFWSPSPHRPNPNNRFFLKQASSAAHIYGKRIVGAESFTTIGPHWNDELWHNQKSSFDHEICAGLNRMYFHTFTCSPQEMGLPGQEYFAGTHVNPQVTWWNESGPFIDYMHRTQLIVQNGKFIADVLYYYGDHVPNVFPYKHADPAGAMLGFDYDVTNEDIFLKLKVENGKIMVPGGITYEVLVLPTHQVLSLATLIKVEELLQKGAHIIGHKPKNMITLIGGNEAQEQFHELTNKIWGEDVSEKGEKEYRKGSVSWGISAKEYLLHKGIKADFAITESDNAMNFDYIHYKIDGKDVYFVSNQTEERQKINCTLRVSGFRPELWNALTGDISEAKAFTQKDGTTTIPLALDPYEATMIVFNAPIDKTVQGTENKNCPDYEPVKNIKGAWTVHFDPKWGGPESVEFAELTDWSENADERIKYYSGTALYNKTFSFDSDLQKDESYCLQLEDVKDVGIAVVKINGKDKGIVWTKPFRVDISADLKKGNNTLEIKVINSWYNRVAGDEILSNNKRFTSTNIVLHNDYRERLTGKMALEPSGLLGPVRIMKAK